MNLRLFLSALSVLLFVEASSSRAAGPEVTVDLRSPRSEIRAALLQHTAISSSVPEVAQFITRHLQHDADAAVTVVEGPAPSISGPNRGAKFIRVYLGQYYDHPEVVFFAAPILAQREVSAIWIFDQHDRLIDIFVDKKTGVY